MKSIFREEVVYSDAIAIADDNGKSITYRQLAERAESLSKLIEDRSLVFVLCDKQIETVEIIYEIIYLNRVPLLLAADINQEMLDNLVTIYQPRYIYCHKRRDITQKVSIVKEFAGHNLYQTNFEKYLLHPDLALLLSTSGTTGSPKLVKLSYENLYDNVSTLVVWFGIRMGQKGICPLPLHYTFGLAFCLWHWHCGATLLVTEKPVIGNEFREFYMREKANNFAATPHTYQMMEKVRFWNQEMLGYLNFAMSGGARMSEKDQSTWVSLMRDKIWYGYGQTECTCGITNMNLGMNNLKLGSIGKALPNIEVILDSETSELCIKSKSVCMGYAIQMEDLTTGDANQGILHTGDIGWVDDDGYVFLKGRLARFIKVLGKRISLDEVEGYIRNRFADIEVACIGTDDNLTVYYSKDAKLSSEKIIDILVLGLKIPSRFITCKYIEKIPVNAAGKIIYSSMRGVE